MPPHSSLRGARFVKDDGRVGQPRQLDVGQGSEAADADGVDSVHRCVLPAVAAADDSEAVTVGAGASGEATRPIVVFQSSDR